MTNRAERRAQAKRSRRGGSDDRRMAAKGRAGVMDERALQERSRRLEAGQDAEWKPTGHTDDLVQKDSVDPNDRNPRLLKAPRGLRQWLRILVWALIICSGLAFLVCMWLPHVPIWATIAIAAVFCLGVLGLFLVGGNRDNPRLDSYGTAL